MHLPRSNFLNPDNNIGEGNAHEPAPAVLRRPEAARQERTPAAPPSVNGHHTDALAASEIEGRSEMPAWQSAFAMAPNVRFTRTPETAISRRPAPENAELAPVVPASAVPEPVPAPTANVAPAVAAAVTAQATPPQPAAPREERRAGLSVILPQPPDATGARALTYKLRRELARQREEAASAGLQQAAVLEKSQTQTPEMNVAAPVATIVEPQQPNTSSQPQEQAERNTSAAVPAPTIPAYAAYLSDHVFWEAMNLDGGADDIEPLRADTVTPQNPVFARMAQPVRPAAAPARKPPVVKATVVRASILAPQPAPILPQVALPAFQAPEWSVIALYREVGLREPDQDVASAEIVEEIAQAAVLQEPVPEAPVENVIVDAVPMLQPSQPVFRRVVALAEGEYEYPPIDLLQEPQFQETTAMTPEALEQSAGLLESVLEDFGIKGEIIDVRPGPVVTLYEFEPAPGVKSSRVIGLSDDIARSMSALSARVAVVPGRNVIGIELPNPVRETVYLRELIESHDYTETRFKLAMALGKTIGGEPVIAELAKMPHLLVAGTTGSGKSVAINTMILSLLYRLRPEECRLIMVDPKMLELSVYDGIPHLLTPVVTDPKKAVMALKWAVREMEDRYRKMSRLGVRNIDGYNARAASARAKGETILCSVQTGFDRSTGEPIFEQEEMDLAAMPYIVVIVDEMADLMMVAGKEIEGAIQRLAQMARAAGIHLIMATQRPSVDVITGTIKANFPTRISFQVTSKIDSRTILGEQGAEHLLGQGDMLHMMGGGRIARVHGPFVSDEEVEKVVAHLKTQGRPEYLGTVTEDADEAEEAPEDGGAVFDKSAIGEEDASDLYDKAVKVVLRDKKCSTSYIQRRLSIGYNKAASLVERMEQEGLVGPANHVGKRSIIIGGRDTAEVPGADTEF
ncbi:FtsK/SpoIIIE domain-containing protein [Rhizobium sp. S95]|uniref:FtsK/SpoIIIE domain-containing protein n=2 Tax=Ciceribacter sichuanensis TaxID=2949647 RepID=A0AAJ1BZY3_9HYPH|nr:MULTISPECIES: DNA translocase FtsK [unclassified Ciceribacter]MCM2397917.1 FtsK/SpoIIIE domain-containing protein [Ciceribacter sp. S95]MCO5959277.1 FtsK/SpoIIIE domain-containing protein [Ciceribacter sp. S101]